MVRRLDDYTADTYSQFGEDGCIAHIFETIGVPAHPVAVEFGAGDGLSCSNTARLWRENGWKAVLVEPDAARFEDLESNAGPFDSVCRRMLITPSGPSSISSVLDDEGITVVDYMSIDVDGDDWHILRELTCRPRVISVEFNPMIPPHIDARQSGLGAAFGASLLALIRLGESLGYRFVGATYCNAFLVLAGEAGPFAERYETDPAVLFPPGNYTYAVTDFAGRLVLIGQAPPWGARDPYVGPIEASAYVTQPSDNPRQIRRGFESLWGPSLLLSPNGLSPDRLVEVLDGRPPIVCVDLSTADLEATAWIADEASRRGYNPMLVGRVLGLICQESS